MSEIERDELGEIPTGFPNLAGGLKRGDLVIYAGVRVSPSFWEKLKVRMSELDPWIVKITPVDGSPSAQIQSVGRLTRCRVVNALVSSSGQSRNQREGHYNFKVKGRHMRKRRPRKIVQLRMSEEVHKKLTALQTLSGEVQNAKH